MNSGYIIIVKAAGNCGEDNRTLTEVDSWLKVEVVIDGNWLSGSNNEPSNGKGCSQFFHTRLRIFLGHFRPRPKSRKQHKPIQNNTKQKHICKHIK